MTNSTTQHAMLPYQQWVFDEICHYANVYNSNVLEIGGVPNQAGIASNLIDLGATTVLQINNRPDLSDQLQGSLQLSQMDARNITRPDNTYDIIFSASVLEHLLEMPTVLNEFYRATKPGGIVVLHGGCFWNSAWGHHVWVRIDGQEYLFNGNNPLPDWSHLYLDRFEMADMLTKQDFPKSHVEKIIYWVYDSEEINRLTYDNLIQNFNQSQFDIFALTPKMFRRPSPELLQRMRALHGNSITNYMASEAVVVLQKPWQQPSSPQSQQSQQIISPSNQPVAPITTAKTEAASDDSDSSKLPNTATPFQRKESLYQKMLPIHGDRFESILEHFYTGVVTEGDTVIDVGAHAGRHMFPLLEAVGETGMVYAFEPIPNLYDKLNVEVAQRRLENQVNISRCALSKEKGTTQFLHVEDAMGLSGLKHRTSHDGHNVKKIDVEVTTLDACIPASQTVKFIKIDAEGADFFILQAAERILKQDRPIVGFESGRINAYPAKSYNYTEAEFNAFFQSIDYVLYDIVGLKYETPFWNLPTLNDLIAIPTELVQPTLEQLQIAMLTEFAVPKT